MPVGAGRRVASCGELSCPWVVPTVGAISLARTDSINPVPTIILLLRRSPDSLHSSLFSFLSSLSVTSLLFAHSRLRERTGVNPVPTYIHLPRRRTKKDRCKTCPDLFAVYKLINSAMPPEGMGRRFTPERFFVSLLRTSP